MQTIVRDRVLAVVRADSIPDAAALTSALGEGGIHVVEFTFTTPGILAHLAAARSVPGAVIGAGTVLTADQARAAIDAGAQFLVTPGLRAEVVGVAERAGVDLVMGAFTPSEVMSAIELGAAAVKIFPARLGGPRYFADLRGPLPDVRLIPSGGVDETNAREFLRNGAIAVTAGTSVVSPAAVTGGDFDRIRAGALAFVDSLGPA